VALTAPALCCGVRATIVSESSTATAAAGVTPKSTEAPCEKLVPLIVTLVPPLVVPKAGDSEVATAAGGAGSLMRELPTARLLVHPRGLRHLLDPSALQQAVTDIYGPEAAARDYGTLLPVDPARAVASEDGMVVRLGARRLELAHTPGHAQHHHCLWDEACGGWFAGDTFGVSYREFDTARGAWMVAISTPVQFDPPALRASIERLLARQPRCMHLTHYGRVTDVARLGAELLAGIDRLVSLAQSAGSGADRELRMRQALLAGYQRDARARGCMLHPDTVAELLAMDATLNAQGLGLWLDHQGR